ncbi:MAG: hypothetical protein PUJ87_09025 [Prevotellaceae bacterium]|nr:hypothetical protein [Prevotellaceae bacterium]
MVAGRPGAVSMMVGAIRSVQLTAHRAGVWVAVIPASSGPTGIDEIKATSKAGPYHYDLQGLCTEYPLAQHLHTPGP